MANIFNHYMDMWRNFANFSGRTTVGGYWWAYLVNWILSLVLGYVPYVGIIYTIAAIIPGIAITVRRLNDAGKHWAWIFINLIPLVGQIIFIILLCKPSTTRRIVDAD